MFQHSAEKNDFIINQSTENVFEVMLGTSRSMCFSLLRNTICYYTNLMLSVFFMN